MNKELTIKGDFEVDKVKFSTFFATIQQSNPALFEHKINAQNCAKWANNLKKWSGRNELTLGEFIAVFCIVYNETGGQFKSIAEQGTREYIETANPAIGKVAYAYKERGRGYIQVTWAKSYRLVLSQLGYDYDALTSEQLDDLFLRNDNVAFGALRIWFNDANFAKKTFDRLKFGEYKAFGNAIGGGQVYGIKFENRVNTILKALSTKKLDSSIPFYKQTWFWIAILVIFAISLWLYRDLVFKSYKTAIAEIKN
jgi:hypothetical protein